MLMTATPCVVPSTALTAEIVTDPAIGTAAGAVYRPALVIVPTVGSPPAVLFTFHVTDWLAVPVTVAWNCNDAPVCTVPLPGTTFTAIAGLVVGEIVRVRATVGVALTSVRTPVGVEVGAMVTVAVTVAVGTISVGRIVGVDVAPEVTVRAMVSVGTVVLVVVGAMVTVFVAVGVGGTSVGTVVGVDVAPAVAVPVFVGVNVGSEVTVRIRGDEIALGPGFATLMLTEPACVAVPVAVSWVDELNVVDRGTPFHSTRAPLTKRLPTTFKVNGPTRNGLGVSAVGKGV